MTKLFSLKEKRKINIDWDQCSKSVRAILEGFLSGEEISIRDGVTLFSANPGDEKFIIQLQIYEDTRFQPENIPLDIVYEEKLAKLTGKIEFH